jgi:hypothetical protein
VHHPDNASPVLCIRTHHITAVNITSHTLNNFNFHYFIIVHSYLILYYIIQKKNFYQNYTLLVLWSDCDTFNYNYILVPKTSAWPTYWPKYIDKNIIKMYDKIEVHFLLFINFINLINARNMEH